MFILIWPILLFAVRSNNNAVASPVEKEGCHNGVCITPEITAEVGLCVVIPCHFTNDPGFTLESAVLYKCDPSNENCTDSDKILHLNNTKLNAQSGSRGRVSFFYESLNNCSVIINDITEADAGSYQLRVNSFLNGTTKEHTSPRANVTVKDLTQKPTVMTPPLTEGQQTTLTCTAPGLCSGSHPKFTWTWRGAGENDSHITGNITAFKTENLTAVSQRHSSTLTFNHSAEHHGTNVTCKVSFTNNITTEETVTLNVAYVKKSVITGNTTVKEGDALNLTCNVESLPPSLVKWTKVPSNKNLHSTNLQNNTGSATLVISNVTAEHAGQYICTAQHGGTTRSVYAKVTVTFSPKILNSSGCINQSDVLTCVCISEGFPSPTIKWPLLENHTEHSLITTVSNHMVKSTATLTVTNYSNTVVECVSSNNNGEVKGKLIIKNVEKEGQFMEVLRIISRLEVIIAFLVGALLSAIICCLVRKCHRKKQTIYGNLTETLEMVTSHEDPPINAALAMEDYQAFDQVAAAEAGGAMGAGKSDVNYSKIDFSLIKRKSPAEEGMTQGTPETEYAEIKELNKMKEEAEESQDGEGEEEMIREDEKTNHCVQEEKEGEEVALYSNVKDIMSEISVA